MDDLLSGFVHRFDELVASDASAHVLDAECWCRPAVSGVEKLITHHARRVARVPILRSDGHQCWCADPIHGGEA